MKIVLSNGKEIEVLGVHGRPINYQGVTRDSLIFMFEPEKVSVNEIMENFTEEACSTIRIIEDDDSMFLHENYTLRIEVGCAYKELITSGGISGNDVSQSTFVRMAQTTLSERTIQQQQKIIDTLITTVLEG